MAPPSKTAGPSAFFPSTCSLCSKSGELLCCDSCPRTFHLACLGLASPPKSMYRCELCVKRLATARRREGKERHAAAERRARGTKRAFEDDGDSHHSSCDVCGDVGDLLCCDACPRVYHLNCADLERVPDGKWTCTVCESEVRWDEAAAATLAEQVRANDAGAEASASPKSQCSSCGKDGKLIHCHACRRAFHVACADLRKAPQGEWHCHDCEDEVLVTHDDTCKKCRKDGELICCDTCPSAYHSRCAGLLRTPEGAWKCPPCKKKGSKAGKERVTAGDVALKGELGALLTRKPLGPDATWFNWQMFGSFSDNLPLRKVGKVLLDWRVFYRNMIKAGGFAVATDNGEWDKILERVVGEHGEDLVGTPNPMHILRSNYYHYLLRYELAHFWGLNDNEVFEMTQDVRNDQWFRRCRFCHSFNATPDALCVCGDPEGTPGCDTWMHIRCAVERGALTREQLFCDACQRKWPPVPYCDVCMSSVETINGPNGRRMEQCDCGDFPVGERPTAAQLAAKRKRKGGMGGMGGGMGGGLAGAAGAAGAAGGNNRADKKARSGASLNSTSSNSRRRERDALAKIPETKDLPAPPKFANSALLRYLHETDVDHMAHMRKSYVRGNLATLASKVKASADDAEVKKMLPSLDRDIKALLDKQQMTVDELREEAAKQVAAADEAASHPSEQMKELSELRKKREVKFEERKRLLAELARVSDELKLSEMKERRMAREVAAEEIAIEQQRTAGASRVDFADRTRAYLDDARSEWDAVMKDATALVKMHEEVTEFAPRPRDTLAIYDKTCLQHGVPDWHAEHPGRLAAFINLCASFKDPELHGTTFVSAEAAESSDPTLAGVFQQPLHVVDHVREECKASAGGLLKRVHGEEYIVKMIDLFANREDPVAIKAKSGRSDEIDTYGNLATWNAVLTSVGLVCQAVDSVLKGTHRNAFCGVRPPGHHAGTDGPADCGSQGFCFVNNAAVACHYAVTECELKRVAVFDFDVHHGNGTQEILAKDERFLFISIHVHGRNVYPGTGGDDDAAPSNCLNLPVPVRADGIEYRARFPRVLAALRDFKPDLILISAGFDAHKSDQMQLGGLDAVDFHWMTNQLVTFADAHCNGRVVSILEGGYGASCDHSTRVDEEFKSHDTSTVDSIFPKRAQTDKPSANDVDYRAFTFSLENHLRALMHLPPPTSLESGVVKAEEKQAKSDDGEAKAGDGGEAKSGDDGEAKAGDDGEAKAGDGDADMADADADASEEGVKEGEKDADAEMADAPASEAKEAAMTSEG